MSDRDVWDGKPVVFSEFSIKDGKEVRKTFVEDGEDGAHKLLVLSLRWADTNELVFKSLDELEALNFRHREHLSRLALKAARANGMKVNDPDIPSATNGHAVEPAGPPH